MHLSVLLLAQAIGLSMAASSCFDVSFKTYGEAQNRKILVEPDFSSFEGLIKFLTQPVEFQRVNVTALLKGTYCRPTRSVAGREGTLQLLLHGNTYTRSYFEGFGSKENSWVDYFLDQGYPVLNLDRPGNGESELLEPNTEVQAPLQTELINNLIKQLKGPQIGMIPSAKQVIMVGHSYGSILSNQLAGKYPAAADAYVLTGIAIPKSNQNPLPGQFAMGFTPASAYDPQRFPPSKYPPGYLTTSSKDGRMEDFYGDKKDFASTLYDIDFATEGTITTGEALTQNMAPAQEFKGPVFILTGREDAVFCGNGTRHPTVPDCGTGADSNLAAMKVLYPAVADSNFGYYAQEKAGHCNGIHYSAPKGFKKVQNFLTAQGL